MSEMVERLGLVVRRSHAWQACEEMDAEQLVREILAEMREMTPAMKRLDASLAEGWNTAVIPPTRYAPLGSHTGASWEQLIAAALA